MLFSEIAVQNVTGFPPAGRIPLRPGLNAFVSRTADPFALTRALLDPSDKDAALAATTPCKVALTIVADDGTTYRLVRDATGGRILLRSDPVTKQPVKLSEDSAEIEQHLRAAVGLPAHAPLTRHLWLSSGDLPSRAPPPKAAKTPLPTGDAPVMSPAEARAKAPLLKAELARAEKFEQMQDGIFQLQQKLEGMKRDATSGSGDLDGQVAEVQGKIERLNDQLGQAAGLESKIKKWPESVARRDAGLAELKKRRDESEASAAGMPSLSTLMNDKIFLAGAIGGVACVAGGIFMGISWLLPLDMVPFGLATFVAWKWVGDIENAEMEKRKLSDFGEWERRIQKQFEQETLPVQTAMKALGAATPDVVIARIEERETLLGRMAEMQREVIKRKNDPTVLAAAQERETVEKDLRAAEAEYAAMGFTREAGVIRREMELAEAAATTGDDDPIAMAIEAAAELGGLDPRVLLDSLQARLAQYMAALTDRRFVGVRPSPNGPFQVAAANGAAGPLAGLPPGDRDLIYVALRLALAERVGAPAKLPLLIDEPTHLVDGPHRGLFVQMLKALSATTQVIVRAFDAPPAGMVDHVAAAGAGA